MLVQRYHLVTREERLDAVAKDIVHHFLNRGYQGKAGKNCCRGLKDSYEELFWNP